MGGLTLLTLLNPNLSVDRARDIFKTNGVFAGFMHELPGLVTAIDNYIQGKMTDEAFITSLKTILLHNGPQKGFWDFLTKVLLPKGPANELFEGGLYWNDQEAKVAYPNPVHIEGILSAGIDRLDQGIGGVHKIMWEILPMLNLVSIKNDLLGNNQKGTIAQLDELHSHTAKLLSETESELAALSQAGVDSPEVASKTEALAKKSEAYSIALELIPLYKERVAKFQTFVNDNKNVTLDYKQEANERGNHEVALTLRHKTADGQNIRDVFNAEYHIDASKQPAVFEFKGGKWQRYVGDFVAPESSYPANKDGQLDMMRQAAETMQDFVEYENTVNGKPADVTTLHADKLIKAFAEKTAAL